MGRWGDVRGKTLAETVQRVTSCEVGRAKPDGAIFAAAAERLGLRPHEIRHIGDRWDRDVAGALSAGFEAAWYVGLARPAPGDPDAPPDAGAREHGGVRTLRRLDDPSVLERLESAGA